MKTALGIISGILIIIILIAGVAILSNNAAKQQTPNNTSTTPTPTPVTTPNTTGTSAKVDVSIDNMSFPAVTTINNGQTVIWTNNDNTSHTVTFDDGSVNSGTIAPRGSFTHTFSTAGSFSYHCNFHPTMVGTIVVK